MRHALGCLAAASLSALCLATTSDPGFAAGRGGVASAHVGAGFGNRGGFGHRGGGFGAHRAGRGFGRYGYGGFGYGGYGFGAYGYGPGFYDYGGNAVGARPIIVQQPAPGIPVAFGIRETPSLPPAIYVIGEPARPGAARARRSSGGPGITEVR